MSSSVGAPAMECQTLPSTSSLSGTSNGDGASVLAPRRRTTLPKAAVFILPKRGSGRLQSADVLIAPSSPISPGPHPPAPPLPLPPPGIDAMDVDYDASLEVDDDGTIPPPSPLPPELRGKVRLLPRCDEIDSTSPAPRRSSAGSSLPSTALSSSVRRSRPRLSPPPPLPLARMVTVDADEDQLTVASRSGLRHLMPVGARVAIGGSAANTDAFVALSVQHAAVHTGSACPYDDFVSAPRPSLWKRFTRRVKASLTSPAPRPQFQVAPTSAGN